MEKMRDIRKLLTELIEVGENEVVEFKEARRGKWSDFVGQYVSALSNEANLREREFGWLCYGVNDKRGRDLASRVVGTDASIGRDFKHEIAKNTTNNITIREVIEGEVEGKRVLLIKIPAAPRGIPIAWKGMYYGRNGESLVPLSADKFDTIRVQSGLADWSAEIDEQVGVEDLDETALGILKNTYSNKQNNSDFLALPTENVLSDLGLLRHGGVTHAALILLGRKEVLKTLLPNAAIHLEYRTSEADIEFQNRIIYDECFLITIRKLWHDVNVRNISIPIQDGPYIINILAFNEIVIREAICNAIAHRDYRMSGETLIKQYPDKFTITNAGGFPMGVTKENILKVLSTPRNRLLSDVLSKIGLTERSGQGVDKIFKYTLSEGKGEPDYDNSNEQMVELTIPAKITHQAFALFVNERQQQLSPENRLSVFEIIALEKICADRSTEVPRNMIQSLLRKGAIEKSGATKGTQYFPARRYYEIANDIPSYMQKKQDWDVSLSIPLISTFLHEHNGARFREIRKIFVGHLSSEQVKRLLRDLATQDYIYTTGNSSGTRYWLRDDGRIPSNLYFRAMQIGMNILKNQTGGFLRTESSPEKE